METGLRHKHGDKYFSNLREDMTTKDLNERISGSCLGNEIYDSEKRKTYDENCKKPGKDQSQNKFYECREVQKKEKKHKKKKHKKDESKIKVSKKHSKEKKRHKNRESGDCRSSRSKRSRRNSGSSSDQNS